MIDCLVLFCKNFADVGIVAAIASARHSCPALAAELFIPGKFGMVFADPPYSKTNGTAFIHWAMPDIGIGLGIGHALNLISPLFRKICRPRL